jgi:polysaccharide chain length determinant protein (PEP-CTERM system associated)
MTETADEQLTESINMARILEIARRRYVHFLIGLFAGWLIIWGTSWIIAPRYKSNTLILVQEPTMPADYVQPNVGGNLQDRLQSITQQIMSRTRLLMIIKELNLYGAAQHRISDDEMVDHMRKDIVIDLVRDTRNNEINAFRISFIAPSPQVAQAVTTHLTNLFISENLRVRQEESEGTTQFLDQQLSEARARLSDQEAKVRAFQSLHMGDLPSQQASNMQILGGLQSQLQNEQDALNTAKQQRVYMQALIEQNRPSKVQQRNADPAVVAIDLQLTQLRTQLVDLSARYTDKYPDVVRVKEQIAETERQRTQLINSEKNGTSADSADAGGAAPNTALAQLQGQLHANQLEIANRERSVADLQNRIAQYQGRLNGAPATEQELADLTRGYDQLKASYDDLLKKQGESAMATSMEQMQQGERFTILDPPSLPGKPDFPNRIKFFLFGLLFGVGLGTAVAGVFEWLDDRLYSESEIKALLPVAVLSEIPQVKVASDAKRAKKNLALKWAMTVAVLVMIVAGAAFSMLHA